MSDRLRMDPMTGGELEAFIAYSREVYVPDPVTNGGEDRRAAEETAASQFAAHLRTGRGTTAHDLSRAVGARGRGPRGRSPRLRPQRRGPRAHASLGYDERSITMAKTLTP